MHWHLCMYIHTRGHVKCVCLTVIVVSWRTRKTRFVVSAKGDKSNELRARFSTLTGMIHDHAYLSVLAHDAFGYKKIFPDISSFLPKDLRENSARTGERETRNEGRKQLEAIQAVAKDALHQLVRKYLDSPCRPICRERVFRYQMDQVTS